MKPYEFFSMFTIIMTVTLIFSIIFVENKKIQTLLGIESILVYIIGFILLNMTQLQLFSKNIIVLVILVLYAQITVSIIITQTKKIGKEIR